ncbi:MAG TPA: sigma-54 dependent transcriptional regulator [Clostridia bacterium]|nr:sigma-54 dependent transcriptional regulator [Clostridia bacterium]
MSFAGTILVVDDEPSTVKDIARLIEPDSYRLQWASTGTEALEHFQKQPHPDLVLLDYMLPDFDGLETMRRIRMIRPDIKIVMLSCMTGTRFVAHAIRLGAQDYLSKPVHNEELQEVLRQCFKHSPEDASMESIDVGNGTYFFAGSPAMKKLRSQAAMVAKTDLPLLILGESGTGKEVLSRLIHKYSARAHRMFLKVNCAAVPADLLESELFGYEQGAFTGANKTRLGRFELANNGTVFLDEIGEMPPALQAKLLQVLQEGKFSRLGSRNIVQVDVRILAATNINMEQAIANRTFREDLYYRLNGFTLEMPPLRERREEIPLLLKHMMVGLAERYAKAPLGFSEGLMQACVNYAWPGNLREMDNFLKRYLVFGDEASVITELTSAAAARPSADRPRSSSGDLKQIARDVKGEAEMQAISEALQETSWNRKRAAALLNISYKALLYKIKQYGIDKPVETGVPSA